MKKRIFIILIFLFLLNFINANEIPFSKQNNITFTKFNYHLRRLGTPLNHLIPNQLKTYGFHPVLIAAVIMLGIIELGTLSGAIVLTVLYTMYYKEEIELKYPYGALAGLIICWIGFGGFLPLFIYLLIVSTGFAKNKIKKNNIYCTFKGTVISLSF